MTRPSVTVLAMLGLRRAGPTTHTLATFLFLGACGGASSAKSSPPRPAEDRYETPLFVGSSHEHDGAAADASTSGGCIVVQGEANSTTAVVEGLLLATRSSLPLVLRLSAPRCVVGLARGSVVTEVAVATAGPDLRPLVGARLRIAGDALAGDNDMGGAAVIIVARDVARLEPQAHEP